MAVSHNRHFKRCRLFIRKYGPSIPRHDESPYTQARSLAFALSSNLARAAGRVSVSHKRSDSSLKNVPSLYSQVSSFSKRAVRLFASAPPPTMNKSSRRRAAWHSRWRRTPRAPPGACPCLVRLLKPYRPFIRRYSPSNYGPSKRRRAAWHSRSRRTSRAPPGAWPCLVRL